MHKIMADLHQEHLHLARVFDILDQQLEQFTEGKTPDLFLMADILNYVQHYPDLVHHPKEDLVYEVFRTRTSVGMVYVVQLQKEHYYLPFLTNELHTMLQSAANSVAFVSRDVLKDKIEHYLDVQRKHMDLEESVLFPLIEKTLTDEDWKSIELSNLEKADPLFGDSVEACYENLYQSIQSR